MVVKPILANLIFSELVQIAYFKKNRFQERYYVPYERKAKRINRARKAAWNQNRVLRLV